MPMRKGQAKKNIFPVLLLTYLIVRVLLRFRLIVLELIILGRHEKVNYECLLQRTVINGSSFSSGYQVVDESTGKFELAALLDALKD